MKQTVFIFIPMYQAGAYICQAVESVLAQTYQDWELLILDDASTDEGPRIAKDFAQLDARIRYEENEINVGMLNNWNKGISLCTQELMVKLDADDVWHPTFLEESIQIIERHPEVALIFSKYEYIDGSGKVIETQEGLPEFAKNNSFYLSEIVKKGPDFFLGFSILRQGVSLMRTNAVNRLKGYRFLDSSDTQASTDTDFYFRIGCHYPIYQIDKVLYQYRIHSESISRRDELHQLQNKKMYEVKKAIIQYYHHHQILTDKEVKKFIAQINAEFWISAAAFFRSQANYFQSVRASFYALFYDPRRTGSFYVNRIKSRSYD